MKLFSRNKEKKEFSKILLIQESALLWINTLGFLILAYIAVIRQYSGSLPWLTAMASLPWTAYGVSQVWYYKKSTVENSKDGVKYETVLKALEQETESSFGTQYTSGVSNKDTDTDPFGPI